MRLVAWAQNAWPIVIGYTGGSPDPTWTPLIRVDANEWKVKARPLVGFESRARSDLGCGDKGERHGGGRTALWRRVTL